MGASFATTATRPFPSHLQLDLCLGSSVARSGCQGRPAFGVTQPDFGGGKGGERLCAIPWILMRGAELVGNDIRCA